MRPRRRIDITADIAAPPDWWADLFRRRQRRLRTLIAQKLDAAGKWISTAQVRSLIDRYEAEEIEHALAGLAADGVIDCDPRTEPVWGASSRIVHRTYWRLAEPEPCRA